jgi:hypothetical protein
VKGFTALMGGGQQPQLLRSNPLVRRFHIDRLDRLPERLKFNNGDVALIAAAFSSAKGRTIRRAARSATLTSAAHGTRRSRIGRLQRKHVRFVIAVEVSDDERPQILITRVEYLPGALASPRREPLAVRAACDVGDAVAVEIGEYELRQLNRRADVEGIPCLRYVIPNEPFAVRPAILKAQHVQLRVTDEVAASQVGQIV